MPRRSGGGPTGPLALEAERARLAAAGAALAALDAACNLVIEATLTAAGYHRHDYHHWRRRRVRAEADGRPGAGGEDEIRALLERARRGDPEALPALRRRSTTTPRSGSAYGDLAMPRPGRLDRADRRAGPGAEGVAGPPGPRRCGTELAGPDPSPLESLLVERIVACWLQVGYADAAVAQAGDVSIKQADFARKRQDSAHKRYLTAIGALAMVRKLIGRSRAEPRRRSAGDPPAGPGGGGHPPGRPGRRGDPRPADRRLQQHHRC